MQLGGRILAVDDDLTNLEVIEEIFGEDPFDLMLVDSGEACLEVLDTFKPDVLLLDLMMPGIDGYEVCNTIRQVHDNQALKIIIVSAKAMLGERLEGYKEGANDYITKPFNIKELEAKVSAFLRIARMESELLNLNEDLSGLLEQRNDALNSSLGFIDSMIERLTIIKEAGHSKKSPTSDPDSA